MIYVVKVILCDIRSYLVWALPPRSRAFKTNWKYVFITWVLRLSSNHLLPPKPVQPTKPARPLSANRQKPQQMVLNLAPGSDMLSSSPTRLEWHSGFLLFSALTGPISFYGLCVKNSNYQAIKAYNFESFPHFTRKMI